MVAVCGHRVFVITIMNFTFIILTPILEFISLPLVNGAVFTALVGSLLNGIALYGRMRHEDAVLLSDEGYRSVMGGRAALLPGIY